jgi:hypothetical protein
MHERGGENSRLRCAIGRWPGIPASLPFRSPYMIVPGSHGPQDGAHRPPRPTLPGDSRPHRHSRTGIGTAGGAPMSDDRPLMTNFPRRPEDRPPDIASHLRRRLRDDRARTGCKGYADIRSQSHAERLRHGHRQDRPARSRSLRSHVPARVRPRHPRHPLRHRPLFPSEATSGRGA